MRLKALALPLAVRLALACTGTGIAGMASAQGLAPNASQAAASAAMAVLGIAATPNDTLPSLSFLTVSGARADFRSTQFKGGGYINDGSPLHLEGLVAYQIYNPDQVFPKILPGTALDLKWTSIAGTAGVGWDIPLRDDWIVRPVAHLSLGYVSTDAFLDRLPGLPQRAAVSQAVEGSLTSGGGGASISLFRLADLGAWDAEYRFRQTYMEFFPIDEPKAGNARANSNQTTFFSRHRRPLPGLKVLDMPVRSVIDAGIVLYHGDGARVLGTDWLATAGAGIEIDTTASGAPLVKGGRIMLNGVLGDGYSGFSIGLGVNF